MLNRPLKDVRPLGPIASYDSGIVFKVDYTVQEVSSVDIDTLEDNLEDKLYTLDNEVKDVDVTASSSGNVTVRVHYDGDTFSDTLEDEMSSSIKQEMQRLGANGINEDSYEYIL